MLVPTGWEYHASVTWNRQLANLASTSVEVIRPDGAGRLQVYPISSFLWLANAELPLPEGSEYMGGVLRQPALDPADYLRRFLLPAYRPGITGDSVVSEDSLSALAESVWRENYNSDRNTRVTGSRLLVRYQAGGRAYEEAFYCMLSFTTNVKLPGSVIWRPEMLYSIRDSAGALRRNESLLMAVASSITMDRGWYANYFEVRRKWVQDQMQSIRNAGEMSRYIALSNDEISTFITSSYKAQNASQDRIENLYGETVHGVETFTNPYSLNQVRLPTEYGNAWVSAGGEYLLSKDPDYDPNAETAGDWKPLPRAQ
jgi:hypothetical protein